VTASLEFTLQWIAADLNELQLDFALMGGLAVSVRTEPRFTRDAREISSPLSAVRRKPDTTDDRRYRAEQGVGFQPSAPGSFLKSVVVMYGRVK
jgi:hypothetical protein